MNNRYFSDLIQFDGLQKLEDDQYNLPFSINRESKVFDGHFPNQPILPGVVMIEMTKRALEMALGAELILESAGNFKFLKLVDPNVMKNAVLDFTIAIKEDAWRVKAQLIFLNEIYFKADAIYKRK